MPTLDEVPSERTEISGFIHLVNLFKPFDEKFVGLWNKSRSDCSTEWLAQLQRRLARALPTSSGGAGGEAAGGDAGASAHTAQLECTESQAADLLTSQQWLRTMVWRLSITNGYLSSAAHDSSMTFRHPIEIARDLVAVTTSMSQQSMEVHGVGLVSGRHIRYYTRPLAPFPCTTSLPGFLSSIMRSDSKYYCV